MIIQKATWRFSKEEEKKKLQQRYMLLCFIKMFAILCVSLYCLTDEVEDSSVDQRYVCDVEPLKKLRVMRSSTNLIQRTGQKTKKKRCNQQQEHTENNQHHYHKMTMMSQTRNIYSQAPTFSNRLRREPSCSLRTDSRHDLRRNQSYQPQLG